MKSHAGKHAIYKYISSKIEFLVWVKGHRKWLLGLESVCVSCVMCGALVQEGSGKDGGRDGEQGGGADGIQGGRSHCLELHAANSEKW